MKKSGYILRLLAVAITMIVGALGLYADGNEICSSGDTAKETEQYAELCADVPFEGIAAESISIPAPTASGSERNRVQWRYTRLRTLAYVQNCDQLSGVSADYITLSTGEAIALCKFTRSCDYYVYAERKILI